MNNFKSLLGLVVILLSYSSTTFSQASPPQNKMIGFYLGVDNFYQRNSSSYKMISNDAEDYIPQFSERTRKLIPAVGLSYIYSKKENRLHMLSFNLAVGIGKNENREYGVPRLPDDYFEYDGIPYQPIDNLIRVSDFEPYRYFKVQAGYGLFRSKTFENQISFIYGFEAMLGYQNNNFKQYRSLTQEVQEITVNEVGGLIGFRLMITYPITENISIMATTRLASINMDVVSESRSNYSDSILFDLDLNGGILTSGIGIVKHL